VSARSPACRSTTENEARVSEIRYVTSSFCVRGECVEVAAPEGGVLVRATDRAAGEVSFTDDEWTAFVQGVKNGEFDLDTLRG
jgi:hypothetical protein